MGVEAVNTRDGEVNFEKIFDIWTSHAQCKCNCLVSVLLKIVLFILCLSYFAATLLFKIEATEENILFKLSCLPLSSICLMSSTAAPENMRDVDSPLRERRGLHCVA